MKITIGRPGGPGFRQFNDAEKLSKASFEQALRDSIMDEIQQDTARVSQLRFSKLIEKIEAAANIEALKIFQFAVTIIQNSRASSLKKMKSWSPYQEVTGFKSSQLGAAGTRMTSHGISAAGAVNWVDLTPRWMRYKSATSPANARRFFMHKNNLVNTLKNTGQQRGWVKRFGGVRVKAQPVDLKKQRLTEKSKDWILGQIEVEIFPNIPFVMLPMLASSRWTDDSDGAFENRMFNGKMAEKLAGPPGRHRPLIQPLVQFWMAFRIPRVIEQAISTQMRQK